MIRIYLILILVGSALLFNACQFLPASILLTGSKEPSDLGFQDGNIKQAKFNEPYLIYSNDAHKGLFILDKNNHRIRFMDANGEVSTFAGTGKINQNTVKSGSTQSLQSDIYEPSAPFIRDNTLYFASPGCIRSIDLSLPKDKMQIKTWHGDCFSQDDMKRLHLMKPDPKKDPGLIENRDPIRWLGIKHLWVDDKQNVFMASAGRLDLFVGAITPEGRFTDLDIYEEFKGFRLNEKSVVEIVYGAHSDGFGDIVKFYEVGIDGRKAFTGALDKVACRAFFALSADAFLTVANLEFIGKKLIKVYTANRSTPASSPKVDLLADLASELKIFDDPAEVISLAYSEADNIVYLATRAAIYQTDLKGAKL